MPVMASIGQIALQLPAGNSIDPGELVPPATRTGGRRGLELDYLPYLISSFVVPGIDCKNR